jgi:hypothetical protein
MSPAFWPRNSGRQGNKPISRRSDKVVLALFVLQKYYLGPVKHVTYSEKAFCIWCIYVYSSYLKWWVDSYAYVVLEYPQA